MQKKGFTLIELLIVIGIIGLLATVAAVSLNTSRAKSRDGKRVADITAIQSAIELYFNDKTTYPATLGTGVLGGANPGGKYLCDDATTPGWRIAPCATGRTTYIANVPPAPSNVAGDEYKYTQTGGGTGYILTFKLEGTVGNLGTGVHTGTPFGMQ